MLKGVISCSSSKMSDTGSKYYDSAAIYGGVYYLKNCYGLDGANQVQIKDISATNNFAKYGGVMYIEDKTSVDITNSQFSINYAGNNGGAVAIIRSAIFQDKINLYFKDT